MAEIKVHYGSYLNFPIKFKQYENTFYIPTEKHTMKGEAYEIKDLEFIEIATNINISKVDPSLNLEKAKSEISAASNWGAAFGIAGIVGERLVKGGKVTFIAGFKDGKKLLATTEEKTFNYILAVFNK